MEFIKTMKKREFIEMGLKALATFLAAFLAVILMEGMIYGIRLNSLKEKSETLSTNSVTSIIYIVEKGDDDYYLVAYDTEQDIWQAYEPSYSLEDALNNYKNYTVIRRAPTAFELTITPVHYVVIAIFMAGVAGFFAYRFISLTKEYKHIEDNFNKTGTIELG